MNIVVPSRLEASDSSAFMPGSSWLGFVAVATTVCGALLVPLGCSTGPEGAAARGPTKLKVCYVGLACEPPIFVAYENGFFEEEGLDVELVKADWDTMRDGLGLGRFQANHTLIMYVLKPIEEGLDIKITGGVHTGCLRVQAGANTDVRRVEDLKGKRVGIAHMGSPPFLFATRVLTAHGLDPKSDVEWITFPPDAVELALDRGQVDAVASAEPIGTLLLAHDKVRKLVDQALDQPYSDEFCCVTVVNGEFARKNPKAAAGLTRALLKAAKWVDANKSAAARIAVEKGYLASTAELNAQAMTDLAYKPAVASARRNVLQVANDMKTAGFLSRSTDPEELTKRAWLDLDGVNDDWIKGVEVEKIVGGGDPPKLNHAELTALYNGSEICDCFGGSADMDLSLRLVGDWVRVKPRSLENVEYMCTPQGVIRIAAQQH